MTPCSLFAPASLRIVYNVRLEILMQYVHWQLWFQADNIFCPLVALLVKKFKVFFCFCLLGRTQPWNLSDTN